jgi:hypothetical protein
VRRISWTHFARKPAAPHGSNPASRHRSPGGVKTIEEDEAVPETSFEQRAHDTLDPDLRHRLISETAYHLYAQRGCADGYDLDDWLQAETQIDHIALGAVREDPSDQGVSETVPARPRRGRSETP